MGHGKGGTEPTVTDANLVLILTGYPRHPRSPVELSDARVGLRAVSFERSEVETSVFACGGGSRRAPSYSWRAGNNNVVEVICESLIAVVRDMRASITKASYSSVTCEFDDFSCVLFGPN